MGSTGASHLYPLPPPTGAGPAEILLASERAAYQQHLVEGFLVSRRASCTTHVVHAGRSALRANFLPWLERQGRYLWEVTPADLDAWAVSLKNSVKTRTHHQYFTQVEVFYDWLVTRRAQEIEQKLGVVLTNPVDRFNRARRLPEDERLVPIPREEVITYFLAASRAQIQTAGSDRKWLQACRNYTMWLVLNWAGLRRMEVVTLSKADVDLVAGTLRVVEGKGGKGRIVQIQPPLAPSLRWYLQEVHAQTKHSQRTPLLFVNARGTALHPDGIANLLHQQQVAAHLAEEDQFTCHGFRRAYATRLYKTLRQQRFRDPLVYVKEQLGHTYLSTTQRYCQLDDDYRFFLLQEAAEALTQHYQGEQHDD